MTDSEFMRLALEEAKMSEEFVGCGVVIVKDGEVLVKTFNTQRKTCNATNHAEIRAIGEAGEKTGNKELSGCVMYCTCEPCTMCLSAAIFAKISKIYYGTSMQETFPNNLPIRLTSSELLAASDHQIEIIGGLLKDDCFLLVKYC